MLDLDDEISFPFTNYTQTPNCNFNVDYKVTLIEKSFDSQEETLFDIQLMGESPDPDYVVLNLED